ncbi:MAG: tyrosine-type recombinase/integrase [Polyangiaceae bacterium]
MPAKDSIADARYLRIYINPRVSDVRHEGMRRDELGGLRWRDLDLERGHVMLDENKTDDPRSWVLDPGVARALKMWKEAYCKDAKVDDHVFVDPVDGAPLYTLHLADQLREDLRASGVTRSALFERSDVPDRSESTTSAPRSSPSA